MLGEASGARQHLSLDQSRRFCLLSPASSCAFLRAARRTLEKQKSNQVTPRLKTFLWLPIKLKRMTPTPHHGLWGFMRPNLCPPVWCYQHHFASPPPLSSQTHHLCTCHRDLALASLGLNPDSTGAGFICLPGSRTSTARLPGAPSPVLGIGWWERETVLLFSSIWHSSRSRQRGNKKYTSKIDLSSAT